YRLLVKNPNCSAGREVAAVGVEYLPDHITAVLARQEQETWGNLVGLAGPAHRRVLAEVLDVLGLLAAEWIKRRPDRSGRDCVHANALLDQIFCERAGESRNRPLGRAIVEQLRRTLVHGHRRAIDDRRALLKVRQRRLRQEEHPEDVGLERPLQLIFGDVADVLIGVLLAGIVDEDVEPAELFDGLSYGVLAELLVSNVARDGDGPATLTFDDLLRLRRIVMLAKIEDRDLRPLPSKQRGGSSADPAAGGGDQRHLSLQRSCDGV